MREPLRVRIFLSLCGRSTLIRPPAGTWEEIGGVKSYVATPTIDYPKDKALLFLTDVFGLPLPNNKVGL